VRRKRGGVSGGEERIDVMLFMDGGQEGKPHYSMRTCRQCRHKHRRRGCKIRSSIRRQRARSLVEGG
jgi:hypothetical protein